MTDPTTFGERLRAARQSAGLTLEQMSERSGYSGAYLSQLENGVRKEPSLTTILDLGESLNIQPCELIPKIILKKY